MGGGGVGKTRSVEDLVLFVRKKPAASCRGRASRGWAQLQSRLLLWLHAMSAAATETDS